MSRLGRASIYIVVFIILFGLVGAVYIYTNTVNTQERILKIFCAGSLKIPLERISEVYEDRYGINVYIEVGGSVESVRKITDLDKSADILAVADYRLIPSYLYPKYADWYIGFASNQIVLVYTNKSKYIDQLTNNSLTWYDLLSKDDVKWGFADPNKDPCGYRAVGVIALASLYYNNTRILYDLLLRRTNFQAKFRNGNVQVIIPSSININSSSLSIRPKSVDLIALLEAGGLDYAFEYKSVAVQHNLSYIELPSKINLGDPSYDKFYSRVSVNILTGTNKEKNISMSSIIYGITILNNAIHRDFAVKFIEILLSEEGREVFKSLGQPELNKLIYNGNVPNELEVYLK